MAKKDKKAGRKSIKKAALKPRKTAKHDNPVPRASQAGKQKDMKMKPRASAEPLATEVLDGTRPGRIEISIDRIEGETLIGDVLVVFPRTREVFKQHGLNLDVEEAGDIYMSLDAFAALRGLKPENLVKELETASREPAPQVQAAVTPLP